MSQDDHIISTTPTAPAGRPPRHLVFGLGAMGSAALADLVDRGAEIAGVYTRASHVGEDAGVVVGRAPIGVPVRAAAEFDAAAADADIALFFTTTRLADLLGPAKDCLAAGIDVLTIAEDALYPWPYDAATADVLDAAARAGGASLVGTGVNEVPMARLPVEFAATVSGVTRIEVLATGDFGQFGAELLNYLQVGVRPEAYAAPDFADHAPITGQSAHLIAALAGLDVVGETRRVEPRVAQADLDVPALGGSLAAGLVSGSTETTTLTTAQGVEIEVALLGACFEPGEVEYGRTVVHTSKLDEPVEMRLTPLPGIETTLGVALSRIPDVLAAPPGFVRADTLPDARFRAASAGR